MYTSQSTASAIIQSIFLLLARLGFGLILLARAWSRWQVEGFDSQVARLAEAGLPSPDILAWGTLALESVGGVLLIFGLLTRVVSFLVIAENVAIIVLLRWLSGPFINSGGFEYNASLVLLGIVFLGLGSGYTGLDSVFFHRGTKADESVDLYQPKMGSTQP